jgi:hypothetical protein
MLEDAVAKPTPESVEKAVTAAHQTGIQKEFVPPLLSLLRSSEHFRHEDIVLALQGARDMRAVDALFETATISHKYLDYDETFGLARKCTWALADIGTNEARTRLEQLAKGENPSIARYAKKRLDHWEDERHRKNA